MTEPTTTRIARTEIANAVVIAIAGLLISFAAYQAALWSGEVGLEFSRANVMHTESVQKSARAETRQGIEVQVFGHWFDAAARNETDLANKYAARIPATLRPAFDAWIALHPFDNPAAPASPFAMPQYAPPEAAQATRLREAGDAAFRRGERAKRVADTYGQAGTILATALFFAGISQAFKADRVRVALLVLASIACALGVLRVFTLPIWTLYSSAS
jgi:type II secretory pathway pseudopilin PulG